MTDSKPHPASYRDPAGFVFEHEGKFYRQVNQCYAATYNYFNSSGLYTLLVKEKKLLSHIEIDQCFMQTPGWYKTLLPQQVRFISYPYEWCFSQWKDAALVTLSIVKKAVSHGMILKDATPFNVQFINGSPVFIDTLSFEKYDAAKPWVAYHQFIACFIAPLLLAKYCSADLLKTFQLYPDGIPLKLLSRLLPFKSRFNLNVLMHVILPATVAAGNKTAAKTPASFSQQKLLHIIDNLEAFVKSIQLPPVVTSWNNYYEATVLSDEYVAAKKNMLEEWMKELAVQTVLDMGTNTGLFAEMVAALGKDTIAVDADIDCIERLYTSCKHKKINNLLPLYLDITNPTAAIGWDNAERSSFFARAKPDLCMALALVHHLAIGKNVRFSQIANTFSQIAPWLIIEFIPKSDPRVMWLLQHREDIFSDYNELSFVTAFEKEFSIEKKAVVANTGRLLFLMKRKNFL